MAFLKCNLFSPYGVVQRVCVFAAKLQIYAEFSYYGNGKVLQ